MTWVSCQVSTFIEDQGRDLSLDGMRSSYPSHCETTTAGIPLSADGKPSDSLVNRSRSCVKDTRGQWLGYL
jgi:hypothetical protein